MTLSLEDVRNKRFRMARKGGYEVLEVDEFVDEVEESFAQLVEENASLKKQLSALKGGAADEAAEPTTVTPQAAVGQKPTTATEPDRLAETDAPVQPAATPQPTPSSTAAFEPVVVTTSAEASSAVVRLVQLSTEQAEHLVREANDEAARIREDASRNAQKVTEDARTRAERLESEARVNAERLQAEAQNRTESLDRELGQRRTQLFGDLDKQRESLTETVARLRDFEQRYRSGLRDHLAGQLSTLERVGLEPEGGPERTAPRSSTAAAAPNAKPAEDQGAGTASAPAEHNGEDGGSSGSPSGTSATPRLDALLGEQR